MGRLRKNYFFEQKLFNNKDYYISAPRSYKGFWNEFIFKNNNPIEIEIGSGKGIFIFQKALKNPNINFVAIDKYPTILSKLINKLNNIEKINNLKIIDIDAKNLSEIFEENEINKIYLNFLDPWPKKHHEKFRVTNSYFLSIFLKLLSPNGLIEFKTDNIDFFNYSLSSIRNQNLNLIFGTKNLYNLDNIDNVQTEYEKKWIKKGYKINKLIIVKK
ncbi:MAG: tRNA (guanosine(46)-N7)-methyltransferase TrmB [Malacoplasma sp.]|nr:tRNA (guanosine(46)-N7)-methyltransferase TrmB [Malacoplasma sp.]